jgi:hypothetical protein
MAWRWLFEPVAYHLPINLPPWLRDHLSTVPNVSVLLIALGLIALFYRRDAKLWWFLAPFLVSDAILIFAAANRDSLASFVMWPFLVVLAFGVFLVGFAFVKARFAWPSGLFLGASALFTLAFQGFISSMLLSGSAI